MSGSKGIPREFTTARVHIIHSKLSSWIWDQSVRLPLEYLLFSQNLFLGPNCYPRLYLHQCAAVPYTPQEVSLFSHFKILGSLRQNWGPGCFSYCLLFAIVYPVKNFPDSILASKTDFVTNRTYFKRVLERLKPGQETKKFICPNVHANLAIYPYLSDRKD